MSNQHRLNRLVQLNAIADRALEINFSRYGDEDESNMGRNAAIAGVGVAGAGGLYARGARYNAANNWEGREGMGKFGIRENLRAGVTGLKDDARGAYRTASKYGSRAAAAPGVAVEAYKSARARGLGELKVGRMSSAKQALKAAISKLRGI